MTDLSVIGTPCARVDEMAALEEEEWRLGAGGTVLTVPLAAPPQRPPDDVGPEEPLPDAALTPLVARQGADAVAAASVPTPADCPDAPTTEWPAAGGVLTPPLLGLGPPG